VLPKPSLLTSSWKPRKLTVVALAQIEPAAFETDVAVGVDGELADLECRPIDAGNEGLNSAAHFCDEKRVPHLEGEPVDSHSEQVRFLELDQTGVVRHTRWLNRRERCAEMSVGADRQVGPDRSVKEWKCEFSGQSGCGGDILHEGEVRRTQGKPHPEHVRGEWRCPGRVDRSREAAVANVCVIDFDDAGRALRLHGQVQSRGLQEQACPTRRAPGWRRVRAAEEAGAVRLERHAGATDQAEGHVDFGRHVEGDIPIRVYRDAERAEHDIEMIGVRV